MANLYDLYYSVAMNRKLSSNKDLAANDWADHADYCFRRDSLLCADYNHNIAGGKWNDMMDQVHIRYTKWHPPVQNIIPKLVRLQPEEAKTGGCVFIQKNNVVVMEAEHYFDSKNASLASWAVVPDMGRTLSGIALFSYTQTVAGASISYKMKLGTKSKNAKVRLILNSTMPFKKGGHSLAARFEGGEEKKININSDLVWGNHYTKMYPTGAARMEITLMIPESADGSYTLTLSPLDPGILFYKVIVDCGGYENSYLHMPESSFQRQ